MEKQISGECPDNIRIQEKLDREAARKQKIGRIIPYMGLCFVIAFFTVVTQGRVISRTNLLSILNQCFSLVLVAVGASFVYAHGGMDFSIGANCGVAQMVGGILLTRMGVPMPVVIAACIGSAMIGSLAVGLISTTFRVPVFIGSMCVRSVLAGILTVGLSTAEIGISLARYSYMSNPVVKALVLIAVVFAGCYLFEFTPLGKREKAIGGNRATAQQAGIKIDRHILAGYALMGICVGIAAVFTMFRAGAVSMGSGSGMEFNIMLAIVLGGFPLAGGDKARVSSAIIGALTTIFLSNGLTIWGLDPNLVNGVKGVLFVAIIGLSYDRSLGKLVA